MTEYLSVPTFLKARYRTVESAECVRCWVAGKSVGGSSSALRDALLSTSRLSDELTRFLVEMDRKLDDILSHMERETLLEDFPLEGRVVELSGAGLVLETKEGLTHGDHMELLLVLEEIPLRMVSLVARVDAALTGPIVTGPPNRAFRVGFASVTEEDRDHIIHYVFQEDRRRIRMQKSEAD